MKKRIISFCLVVFMIITMLVPAWAYEWDLIIPDDSISFDSGDYGQDDFYYNNTESQSSWYYNNTIDNKSSENYQSNTIDISPSVNGKDNVSITGGSPKVETDNIKNQNISANQDGSYNYNQSKISNNNSFSTAVDEVKMINTVQGSVYLRSGVTPLSLGNENLPLTLTKDGKGADASARFIGDNESRDKLPNGYGLNDYITRVNNQKDTIGYCINPFKYGVYPDNETSVSIVDTSQYSENDRKILGIMANGYPQKSPADLGANNDMQAYYATQVAIQHFCFQHSDEYPNARGVRFDNDSWEHWWGNDTVINAAKQIYQNGVANPYTEQSVGVNIKPSSGYDDKGVMKEIETNPTTGDGTFEIELTINSEQPFEYGKLVFSDTLINNLIKSGGKNKILVGGSQVNFQTGILGANDYTEGIRVSHGQSVKIVLDKLLAESYVPSPGAYKTIDYVFTASGNTVKAAYVTKNLNQGYKQDYVIMQPGTAKIGSQIMWTKEEAVPTPPDTPTPEGRGNLKILKYNNKTKQLVAGAVFNVRGVSEEIYDFNVTIQASPGAEIPLVNDGKATPGNGTISFTGLKPGQYQITEVTPPPNFSNYIIGQNSKVVTVEPNTTIFPQVEFFNNPYGQLKIKKVDSVTGNPVNGAILRVRNQTTGFENEYTTMNGGTVSINNLPQGNYEISEVYAPNSYIKSDEVKTATIEWGETTEITYSNTPKTALCITKVDAETGDKLEGARFIVNCN